LQSIYHRRPDRIVFFGSDKSRETLDYLLEEAKREEKDIPEYEFIEVREVDRVNEWLEVFEEQMKKYRDYDVVVDYTSGTKTMTSAAFVMAILYRKEVSVVSGF